MCNVYCACCGRQLVNYVADDEWCVGDGTGKFLYLGPTEGLACHICSKDFDYELGKWPEEKGF